MEVLAIADSKSASVIYVEGMGHFVSARMFDEIREENEALKAMLQMKVKNNE